MDGSVAEGTFVRGRRRCARKVYPQGALRGPMRAGILNTPTTGARNVAPRQPGCECEGRFVSDKWDGPDSAWAAVSGYSSGGMVGMG